MDLTGFYRAAAENLSEVQAIWKRPLTFSEKILFSHLQSLPKAPPQRGRDLLWITPDRVAMQDATAQMAILQFIRLGISQAALPVSIHCDHLINVSTGGATDLERAIETNREVYEFLESAAARFGFEFWRPGAGIIHQIVFEQYALPGGFLIGTDSHTPNAGGMGMLAVGVGGADAVEVMAGRPFGLISPKLTGIYLKGELSGWASAKDVILNVASRLSVRGGTGKILEYWGPGAESISCTGKATICNMGAELGATTSVFAFDQSIADYLRASSRSQVVELLERYQELLGADVEVAEQPECFYDELLEVDLSALEPGWVGPHSPDLFTAVSEMAERVRTQEYPDTISAALIGSCTNSSYQDLTRAAQVAAQALARGLKAAVPFFITPGSRSIEQLARREGLLDTLTEFGGEILTSACGPCIGQWQRERSHDKNTIITSFNRNFRGRNDGNPETLAFIGSPELVTALAAAGRLSFNPLTDALKGADGVEFRFVPPGGEALPGSAFEISTEGLVAPSQSLEARKEVKIAIDPASQRLELLPRFDALQNEDLHGLVLLLKAKGKCTTDHISPAGAWLRYRGHLSRISENMFSGAQNAFTGETGLGSNLLSAEERIPFAKVAADYKARGQGWIVVGEHNYGEGSSREHAAMEPRFLGCRAVIAKSFARIHESNLKKQGLLALTFVRADDYDLISEQDRFDLLSFDVMAPGSTLVLQGKGPDGSYEILLAHSFATQELEWLRAGSALNWLASQAGAP
ncbi:MAG: aconitate hydratase [Deltaproteobacteria bacterium]|nr:aconitate hydratase [Deltaproteobacteria bacterium]